MRIFAILSSLPFLVTIAATAVVLGMMYAADHSPGLRLRMLEVGYKLKNWRAWLRSLPQKLMLYAGVGMVAALSLVYIPGADSFAKGQRTQNLGVVSNRVVTNVGVQFIVNAFLNTTEAENMNYHGSGTGNTAEAVGNTALVTEVASRVAGTQSSPSNGVYRTLATITYGAGFAIVEHGIFSASSAGTLLDRSVFAAVNVANGDSIQFQYDLTFSAGG